MVKVYKMPSDFEVSDVRESFVRQFLCLDPALNLVVDQATGLPAEPYLNANFMHLVKSPHHAMRSGGAVEKKSGISIILQ
jgi:hypothetical protein